MNYFDGIAFTHFGDNPHYTQLARGRGFDGYFGIQYNHSGKLLFGVDGEPEEVVEGACVFISAPGRIYTYGSPAEGIERHHCFICFSGPRTQSFLDRGLMVPYEKKPLIPILKPERFYTTMLELQALLSRQYRPPRAVLLLEDLLLQIQEQPLPHARVNVFCEQYIKKLRQEIVAAPRNNWDFAREANNMSISYSHFRRIFRELIGCAPTQFLIECRLNLAMKLLTGTVLPLCEIAHQCGFDDEFYFSRIFKQHRGFTPSGYRKEFRP